PASQQRLRSLRDQVCCRLPGRGAAGKEAYLTPRDEEPTDQCRLGVLGSAEPGTPASRASRSNRTRYKTTRLPRHAIRVVSGAAKNIGRMQGARSSMIS